MVKRACDVALGVILGVVAAPFIAVSALVARLRLGRPVIFRQKRAGRGSRVFTIYKLRTMTSTTDASGKLLPDQDRQTRLGSFYREWSTDELPSIWNVIKGDMSLVGPRPLLVEYLGLYSEEQMRRHEMRPGLTGLAQVNGRNGQSWEQRLALDVWYVDNWSLWLDLRILAKTAAGVLRREGISASGYATMPRFRGGSRE